MRRAVMLVGEIGEELARFLRPHAKTGRTVALALIRLRQRQRAFAHALEQPLRIIPARNVLAEHLGIELVFGHAHAVGELFGRIARPDCHRQLPQDFAGIELVCHQMDARPGMAVACRDGLGMRVEPGIFGQQRGMDVEHAPLPPRDETGRQDPHISREHDKVRPGIARCLLHRRVVVFACHAPVRKRKGRHAFCCGQLQPFGLRIVGRDQHDLIGSVGQAAGIEQRGHIGALAGHEDRDPGLVRHYASPTSPRARPRSRPTRARCSPCRPPRSGPRRARSRPHLPTGCGPLRHERARPPAPCRRRN